MKKFATLAVALCSATTLMAQADLFGRKPSVEIESQPNTAVPQLLQGEKKSPFFESESSASSTLEIREEPMPPRPSGASSASSRRDGFSLMQAAGYDFGGALGLGATSRCGYLAENGVYLGAMWHANVGRGTPEPTIDDLEANSVANQVTSVELGYEFPVKLLGLTFRNRLYFSLGTSFANERTRLFTSAGNLFYYRFNDGIFARGWTFGIDARMMTLGGVNAFGVSFAIGMRLF
ncbi:MAG: hypothetical protein NZM06_09710 [Chloroherpetonaceae bacterium]|nr:hypothetical protein [Chloroherpetonaceae bacterium]MDW8438055.1 hypothetical protein [Chloroherpetonaceae bacterium]